MEITNEKIQEAIEHIDEVLAKDIICIECKQDHEELKAMLQELLKYRLGEIK